VLGSRWIGWVGGGVMAALFFLIPVLIERHNLFSLRKYFTHQQADEGGAEGRAR
jgi:cbb3-type cytochrome oxidase subunit 1